MVHVYRNPLPPFVDLVFALTILYLGTTDITVTSFSQNDGLTQAMFSRKLVTGDLLDNPIPNEDIKVHPTPLRPSPTTFLKRFRTILTSLVFHLVAPWDPDPCVQ